MPLYTVHGVIYDVLAAQLCFTQSRLQISYHFILSWLQYLVLFSLCQARSLL